MNDDVESASGDGASFGAAAWKANFKPKQEAPLASSSLGVADSDLWRKAESFPLDDPNASYTLYKRPLRLSPLSPPSDVFDARLASLMPEYRRVRELRLAHSYLKKELSEFWFWRPGFSFPLDDPNATYSFSGRLQKERGYSDAYLAAVIMEYRRFMTLKAAHPEGDWRPCFEVDTAWRTHLLYAENYREFCLTCFGRMIEHNECYDEKIHVEERLRTQERISQAFPLSCKDIWRAPDILISPKNPDESLLDFLTSWIICLLILLFLTVLVLLLAQAIGISVPRGAAVPTFMLILTILVFNRLLASSKKQEEFCSIPDVPNLAPLPSFVVIDDFLQHNAFFVGRFALEQSVPLSFAHAAIAEYQKFMHLAALSIERLAPSSYVEEVWRLHMQHTGAYEAFCQLRAGHLKYYYPTLGGGAEEANDDAHQYARTLHLYAETFGEAPPPSIWPSSRKVNNGYTRISQPMCGRRLLQAELNELKRVEECLKHLIFINTP